jgi:hypothetical protein
VVHQVNAPRFVLLSENKSRSDESRIRTIHISYHGECHYNSIHSTTSDGTQIGHYSNFNSTSSNYNDTKKSSAFISVSKAVPWLPDEDIQQALRLTQNEVDEAIELLLSNPNGLQTNIILPEQSSDAMIPTEDSITQPEDLSNHDGESSSMTANEQPSNDEIKKSKVKIPVKIKQKTVKADLNGKIMSKKVRLLLLACPQDCLL